MGFHSFLASVGPEHWSSGWRIISFHSNRNRSIAGFGRWSRRVALRGIPAIVSPSLGASTRR